MADFVFNIAKGRVGAYIQQVKDGNPADSRIVVVPIETTGIEADATLKDYINLSALLAGTSNEQTSLGRKYISAADITLTVDNTNDRLDIDLADLTWVGGTGNPISALLFCYIPDGNVTGGLSADTVVIPLGKSDFAITPDGSDIVAQINVAGWYRAS